MVLAQVAAGIAGLDNHLLAADGPARESELVAGAAPRGLGLAGDAHGSPTVAERVADGPGALVRAHVGGAAVVAARLGRAVVVEGRVRSRARPDQLPAVRLQRPPARRLAAVPVARRLSGTRRPLSRGQSRDGDEC